MTGLPPQLQGRAGTLLPFSLWPTVPIQRRPALGDTARLMYRRLNKMLPTGSGPAGLA